jgi:hypothetical protein
MIKSSVIFQKALLYYKAPVSAGFILTNALTVPAI